MDMTNQVSFLSLNFPVRVRFPLVWFPTSWHCLFWKLTKEILASWPPRIWWLVYWWRWR